MGLMLQALQRLRTFDCEPNDQAIIPAPYGPFRPISRGRPTHGGVLDPLTISRDSLVTICSINDQRPTSATGNNKLWAVHSPQWALGPNVFETRQPTCEIADRGNFEFSSEVDRDEKPNCNIPSSPEIAVVVEKILIVPPSVAASLPVPPTDVCHLTKPLQLRTEFQELAAQLYALLPTAQGGALLLAWPNRGDTAWGRELWPLAMQLTQLCRRGLLVVDATPDQEILAPLGLANLPGLLDCSTHGPTQHNLGIHQLVGLSLLGRGNNSESVVDTSRLHTALNVIRRQYPWLLLYADAGDQPLAGQLAAWADTSVLCVRVDRTERDVMLMARRQLESQGGRVTGCLALQ